jgi:hypothetical protein
MLSFQYPKRFLSDDRPSLSLPRSIHRAKLEDDGLRLWNPVLGVANGTHRKVPPNSLVDAPYRGCVERRRGELGARLVARIPFWDH